MSEADNSQDAAPRASRAALRYSAKFEQTVVALEKLIMLFAADRTPQRITELFDNRTSYGVIRSWRDGRRYVPPWAREIIRNKIALAADAERALAHGPGQSAGWRNVAGYHANQGRQGT